jgi:hypothetical protein
VAVAADERDAVAGPHAGVVEQQPRQPVAAGREVGVGVAEVVALHDGELVREQPAGASEEVEGGEGDLHPSDLT